ncbi:MAG: hypothetical protein H6566_07020 [Lewinellaceae bacterium]|nr:hypothetical protein [Lewinellaceae bacterium]
MKNYVLIKTLIENFPVLGFTVCMVSMLLIGYTIHLGSKAKHFLLKSKWLGIEINIENYNAKMEEGRGALTEKEKVGRIV